MCVLDFVAGVEDEAGVFGEGEEGSESKALSKEGREEMENCGK
jgi:hypothetical protein